MAARTIFDDLANGLQPVPTLLDQMFADIGTCTIIPCLAAGTNAITLTELTNVPRATAYRTGLLFGFIAAATSSGSVTLTFRALGLRSVYYQDGLTLIGTGDLRGNQYYIVSYSSDLNSGAGGWYLINGPGSVVAIVGTGLMAKTSATTGAARTLTAPAAGLTISNPDGVAGNPTFVLANDLAAIEALSSTGIAVRTATDTWAQRTLAAPAGLLWTNAGGVAGNPSVALDFNALTVDGSPDGAADYLASYDASAAGHKKVLPSIALVAGAQALTAAQQSTVRAGISAALKGQYYGPTLSNNVSDATNDIDIAAGEAASIETNPILMVLASGLTKRLDANWAAGTNQGMRYSGAAIANGEYHLWLASKADKTGVDVYADPSPTVATVLGHLQAESGGSAYTSLRRLGSIFRSAGSILPFVQFGNKFSWMVPIHDVNSVSDADTLEHLFALSVASGVQVDAIIDGFLLYGSATAYGLLTSPDQTNTAASAAAYTDLVGSASQFGFFHKTLRTNSSGQLRRRASHASAAWDVVTLGWVDYL